MLAVFLLLSTVLSGLPRSQAVQRAHHNVCARHSTVLRRYLLHVGHDTDTRLSAILLPGQLKYHYAQYDTLIAVLST